MIFVAWAAIEQYWLTPGERRIGREALPQIDALQMVNPGNEQQFQVLDKRAKKLVSAAEESAWTRRDKDVIALLSMYLGMVEARKRDIDFNGKVAREQPQLFREHPEMVQEEQESLNSSQQVMDSYRKILHRALDK